MAVPFLLLLSLSFPFSIYAQSCSNYGLQLAGTTDCVCPAGFLGSNCSRPACGGTIFDGTTRPTNSNDNISSCQCQNGWGGMGCDVCSSASACQSALTASGHSQPSTSQSTGLNNSLTCNTKPRVYTSGMMSCNVINPTLQALFPDPSFLNIQRTINPTLSPLPNVTSFPNTSSLHAQLFYAGTEQFFCSASNCTQTLGDTTTDWTCSNLACFCIPGTAFCGGIPDRAITSAINGLGGQLVVSCSTQNDGKCAFKQQKLVDLFGQDGLPLDSCQFGECVAQGVVDSGGDLSKAPVAASSGLSGGVKAGLGVVVGIIVLAIVLAIWGWIEQRKARRGVAGMSEEKGGEGRRVGVVWKDVGYHVAGDGGHGLLGGGRSNDGGDDHTILDGLNGCVRPGEIMAVLGPSGAGKTTLIEILASKAKSGQITGTISYPSFASTPSSSSHVTLPLSPSPPDFAPKLAFVPQQDILPTQLTVYEALFFAAQLRLPEHVPESEKRAKVEEVLRVLDIWDIRNSRIGGGNSAFGTGFASTGGLMRRRRRRAAKAGAGGAGARGISGGEMRRVSIGLELVGEVDVLVLDEPTSGLDSVSAARVIKALRAIAHDPIRPKAVIVSIHQPSSSLYASFDTVLLLAHGRALYIGEGGFKPAEYFDALASSHTSADPSRQPPDTPPEVGKYGVRGYIRGYNVADYLLEVASEASAELISSLSRAFPPTVQLLRGSSSHDGPKPPQDIIELQAMASKEIEKVHVNGRPPKMDTSCAATFLTQVQTLSGREWKVLRRDKSLFFTHFGAACILGVFCGGLYFKTGITIAGFQSRVGCLFFLGALIAFSALSALYNVVETRALFLRERSSGYYSPTAWLLCRLLFDVIPLRIIPTIIVATITYWMAGLAHDATHFFKFLFILVLFTIAMTIFNFLLATLFSNPGIAILLSALTGLYQMTFAGFFVHLAEIPAVIRWLQWLCPLKFALEALAVNEVGAGLLIQDTLSGVPVSVSASLIMEILFGFKGDSYYRNVLVLFGFIVGFAVAVIGLVWFKMRERR